MKSAMTLTFLMLASTPLYAADEQQVEFKWGGAVMLDYDRFEEAFREDAEGSDDDLEVRRARFWLKSYFAEDWMTKLQIDVSDGEDVKFKDAYVRFKGLNIRGLDAFEVTLGQQKESFGLEKINSSKNAAMIERSMVSNSLTPGRNIGLQVAAKAEQFNWQLGYFVDDNSEHSTAVTGHLSWAQEDKQNNFVHFGAAFSERSMKGDEFRINEKLEVNSSDSLIEGTTLTAENISLRGIEMAWQFRGLSSMAEWQQADVDDETLGTYQYQGGYYQLSYLLSGQNRSYKNGKIGNISSLRDLELTARYSQFRLIEENIKARTWTAGVNYYLNKDTKLMLNFIHAQHEDDGNYSSDNAIALRLQYRF